MDGDKYAIDPDARKFGQKYDVAGEIHPEDMIFDFLIKNKTFPNKESAVHYYFSDAQKSAQKLSFILNSICLLSDRRFSLLEFASGYGCVTRHLGKALPLASVTSCDIHNEAVTFIGQTLGVNSIISSDIPEELSVPEKFDVVFALSFFSHMPDRTWGRWLASLLSACAVGGYLIFTTHGLQSMRHFRNPVLDARGYWFSACSEQRDLDVQLYGQTIVSRDYVEKRIADCGNGELVRYDEAGWWEHQDLYVLRKFV